MAYISSRKISKNGFSFLFCESEEVEGVWKEPEEMLKAHPTLVETYEKLNKPIKGLSTPTNSKAMPNTYQSLIENCLDEDHNDAALDLLESFQNQYYYPPKHHIRQIMDIIVNPAVDKDIASKSYKILQHVLYSTGSSAFENIWKFEKIDSEQEDLWPIGYDNFWVFVKDKFKLSMQNTEDSQSTRILLLLEHIVSVFEIDIQIKQENLLSAILLQLFPKSMGKLRTNLKVVIGSLITSFDSKEISMETIRLSQRLLDQIIILSYADHICYDSLENEIYLQINILDPSRMTLFLQTLLSNTFRCQLLDKALLDSDLSDIKKQHGIKQLMNSPLSLTKIAKIYFYSTPYIKNLTESIAIWRHIFFLCSILQSYINAKTLRQGKVIFHGLEDEEVEVIIDNLLSKRIKELKKWIKKRNMENDLKNRSELLLEMMEADVKQIYTILQ